MKVFLAEDDAAARTLLSHLLTQTGHDVCSFPDGNSLWAAVEADTELKVLILDWMMPGLSGLEICQRLLTTHRKPFNYSILISSNDTTEHIVQGLDAGADDYITKPVRKQELFARLRAAERILSYQKELCRHIDELRDYINGRYQARTRIGGGGVGEVYEGWDRLLQRPVAIKFLYARAGQNSDAYQMAWREANLTATLRHPNIVPIYDCGTNLQGAFLVMELLKGQTLEIIIRGRRLSLQEFQQLGSQVVSALDAAHRVGIYHCDIKPSNIMLEWISKDRLHAWVLDFGLAKFRREVTEGLQDQQVMGSAFYVAPETLLAEVIDGRTDLYSIGHMFFHALTGRPAFNYDDPAQILEAHLREEPPLLSDLAPEVPDAVCDWIHRLMERYPRERFANAAEALLAFNQIPWEEIIA